MMQILEWHRAILLVLNKKAYLATFLLMLAISFTAYAYLLNTSSLNLTLPKLFLGLDAIALATATLISILFSLSITISAFAIFNHASCDIKLSAASVAANIVPLTLCCTTIIPSLLAFLGASTFTIIGVAGPLQGYLATYEDAFILASIVLLFVSIRLSSGQILKYCMVDKHED